MNKIVRRVGGFSLSIGVDPRKIFYSFLGFFRYVFNLITFIANNKISNDYPEWPIKIFPMLSDRFMPAGSINNQYIIMDLWAARKVYQNDFKKVVDVGSRIDGYVTHILSFRNIEIIDIRPLNSKISELKFHHFNMMELPQEFVNYTDCLTSLHALEHFGLGRYGDPLDIDGWIKGLKNMVQILKIGGTLLIAVPIGYQRIEFDAHRVFSPNLFVKNAVLLGLELKSFSYIDDNRNFYENTTIEGSEDLNYGCGCFEFIKLNNIKI